MLCVLFLIPPTNHDFPSRAQTFALIVSTASADLWVAATGCSTCNASLFDGSQSSTFHTVTGTAGQITIHYGSQEISGQLSSDTVNIASFTVTNQTFGWSLHLSLPMFRFSNEPTVAVTNSSEGLLSVSDSGFLGLGFQTLAITRAVPFWQALLNANQLAEPLFSMWLARFVDVSTATELEPGGILTLGGTNSSLYQGSIEYIDMPSTVTPSYWMLDLTSLFSLISLDLDSCSHHNVRSQHPWTINQYNCCNGAICLRHRHKYYWWSFG
jgi:cathepsin D